MILQNLCLIILHIFTRLDSDSESLSSLPTAQSVSIPHAESLLHADCDGEEVNCEIFQYSSQQDDKGPFCASWFMATLKLSGGISIALVLGGPPCGSLEKESDKTLHPKLRTPMSKEGTLLTTGD